MRLTGRNLKPVEGIATTGACEASVDIKFSEFCRLHAIEFVYESHNGVSVVRRNKADMLAEVEKIYVDVNNKLQREIPLDELFEHEEHHQNNVEDGIIPVRFSNDKRGVSIMATTKGVLVTHASDMTAFILGKLVQRDTDKVLFDEDIITIRIVLKDGGTQRKISTRLLYEKIADADIPNILGRSNKQVIETHRRSTFSPADTGRQDLFINARAGRTIQSVELRTTDANYLTVYRGTDQLYEGTPADFARDMKRHKFNEKTGVIVISPELLTGGRFEDLMFYKGQQLRIELDMAAATAMPYVVREIGDITR